MRSHFIYATVVMALLMAGQNDVSAETDDHAEWTVMIFMNADNNLERDAIRNFEDMARVGGTKKVNVVIQFDRIGKYTKSGFPGKPFWTETLRFELKKGSGFSRADAVADLGEVNMGDPKSLRDFVEWSRKKYPAKKYALIIWDHGQGWRGTVSKAVATRLVGGPAHVEDVAKSAQVRIADPFRSSQGSPSRSVSHDETSNDELYNSETRAALVGALQGEKLDVIGYDACLMAMVEAGYSLRGVADFLVASEELEPAAGWRYSDWMKKLVDSPKMEAANLAKVWVESYRAWYNPSSETGRDPDPSTTLSAINLAPIEQLSRQITVFADALLAELPSSVKTIEAARAACDTYAPDAYGDGDGRYYFYHIDLVRFAEQVVRISNSKAVREAAMHVRDEARAMVVANYAGTARGERYGSNGLAIYFPPTAADYEGDLFAKHGYERSNTQYPVDFVRDTHWPELLRAYLEMKK